jgi:hypothetical protein
MDWTTPMIARPSPTTLRAVVNFVLFQLAWFAAILGGASGTDRLAALPAVAVIMLHLGLNRRTWRGELWLIVGVTLLGLIVETAFISLGALHYAGSEAGVVLPPLWILALWLAFGTLPNGSLQWLKGKMLLQMVLGAALGPLSYVAGVRLGAASLGEPEWLSITTIAIGWGLAMPVMFRLAKRLEAALQSPAP